MGKCHVNDMLRWQFFGGGFRLALLCFACYIRERFEGRVFNLKADRPGPLLQVFSHDRDYECPRITIQL